MSAVVPAVLLPVVTVAVSALLHVADGGRSPEERVLDSAEYERAFAER